MIHSVYETGRHGIPAEEPRTDCGCADLAGFGCAAARIAASVTCVAFAVIFGASFCVTGNPALLGLSLFSAIAAFIAWPFSDRHDADPVRLAARTASIHIDAAPAPVTFFQGQRYVPPPVMATQGPFWPPTEGQPSVPVPFVPPSRFPNRHAVVGDHQAPGRPVLRAAAGYTPSAADRPIRGDFPPAHEGQQGTRRMGVGDHAQPLLPIDQQVGSTARAQLGSHAPAGQFL